MPIRIKPTYDLHPCKLNLEGIKGIIEIISQDFINISCYAIDKTWEIYEETPTIFLDAISKRETLDSFRVTGIAHTPIGPDKKIEIVFSPAEARVSLDAQPNEENWFEHLLIDLKKFLLPPDFSQRLALPSSVSTDIGFKVFGVSSNINISVPYCQITLYKKPSDPFWENIKANIVSNIIWAIVVFFVGVLVALITTGQLNINIPW